MAGRARDERGRFLPSDGGGGSGGGGGSIPSRRGRGSSHVVIKDMGFQRTIDRFIAIRRAVVTVGVWRPKPVARYAVINELRFGWKTRADVRVNMSLEQWLAQVQASIVDGSESFPVIFRRLGEHVQKEMQDEIKGLHGLEGGLVKPGGTARKPGLVDKGAMLRAVKIRVSGVPRK